MIQAIWILYGNKSTLKSLEIASVIEKYSGKLKYLGQEIIQRLIIKWLIQRILKEHFVENKYGIHSYIILGDNWRDLSN